MLILLLLSFMAENGGFSLQQLNFEPALVFTKDVTYVQFLDRVRDEGRVLQSSHGLASLASTPVYSRVSSGGRQPGWGNNPHVSMAG